LLLDCAHFRHYGEPYIFFNFDETMKAIGFLLLAVGASAIAFADPGGVPHNAPEINAGSAASALALLSGSVLVLRSRRKK
jgi:hypothetical protein